MERVSSIKSHLEANPTTATFPQPSIFGKVGTKGPNDVVIISALRTPVCKAKRGAFKDTTPDDLLKAVMQETLTRTGIDPAIVGDCNIGNVGTMGSYALAARLAQLRAGFPDSVPLRTTNRQCSSGLQSVASIAADIAAGYIDVGIGGGVESMSLSGPPGDPSTVPPFNMSESFELTSAANCLQPMGMTSENVAGKFGITREQQDAFAVKSHAKAFKAVQSGAFKGEIVPVKVTVTDKEGNEKEVTVYDDEGPRADTTVEGLAKLKAAFKKGGSTTAGNASQVSDGAAVVLMMRRSEADKRGLKPIGVFRGFKAVGCPPEIMGIGPAVAIPALLQDCGLSVADVDLFEVNEAFASQAIYSVQKLGIAEEKVNVNGGAIALGHPLGCTGSRQISTLMGLFKATGKKTGVVSMCIGTGMGAAGLFESE